MLCEHWCDLTELACCNILYEYRLMKGEKLETIGLCKFNLNFFVKLKWRNCLKTNLHLNLTDFIMTKSLVERRLNFNVRQFIHRDYQLLRFKTSLMKFISNVINILLNYIKSFLDNFTIYEAKSSQLSTRYKVENFSCQNKIHINFPRKHFLDFSRCNHSHIFPW